MEELRDIKDIVEVQDSSLEMLIALILGILLLLGVAIYLYRKRRKRRKKLTPREIALQNLKSIDYSSPKDIAYKFTLNASKLLDEKGEIEYQKLVERLNQYKYKKDVPNMDSDLIKQVQEFIKGIKI